MHFLQWNFLLYKKKSFFNGWWSLLRSLNLQCDRWVLDLTPTLTMGKKRFIWWQNNAIMFAVVAEESAESNRFRVVLWTTWNRNRTNTIHWWIFIIRKLMKKYTLSFALLVYFLIKHFRCHEIIFFQNCVRPCHARTVSLCGNNLDEIAFIYFYYVERYYHTIKFQKLNSTKQWKII